MSIQIYLPSDFSVVSFPFEYIFCGFLPISIYLSIFECSFCNHNIRFQLRPSLLKTLLSVKWSPIVKERIANFD